MAIVETTRDPIHYDPIRTDPGGVLLLMVLDGLEHHLVSTILWPDAH